MLIRAHLLKRHWKLYAVMAAVCLLLAFALVALVKDEFLGQEPGAYFSVLAAVVVSALGINTVASRRRGAPHPPRHAPEPAAELDFVEPAVQTSVRATRDR